MACALVVDDEFIVRDLIMRMLTMMGHQVYGAENGVVALSVLDKVRVDLILSDINMPVMDGARLLITLRTQGDQTPFIAMSGYGRQTGMFGAFSADDFIAKPFMFSDLSAAIDRVLATKVMA
jgi:CheY-like chemotaxis protein